MVGWAGSAAQLVQSSWLRNTEVQPNYLAPGNMRMREPGPRRNVNYEGKSIGVYPIEPGDGVGRRPARGRPQADREKIDKGVGKNTGWDNDVHTNTSQQGSNMSGLLNHSIICAVHNVIIPPAALYLTRSACSIPVYAKHDYLSYILVCVPLHLQPASGLQMEYKCYMGA